MEQKHTPNFTLINGGRGPAAISPTHPSFHEHSDRRNGDSMDTVDFIVNCLVAEARKQLAMIGKKSRGSGKALSAECRNQIAAAGALSLLERLCADLEEIKDLAGTRAITARGIAMIVAQLDGNQR